MRRQPLVREAREGSAVAGTPSDLEPGESIMTHDPLSHLRVYGEGHDTRFTVDKTTVKKRCMTRQPSPAKSQLGGVRETFKRF